MNPAPVPGGSTVSPPPPPPPSASAPPAPASAAGLYPYRGDISHWDDATRAPFMQHQLTPFDTAGAVILGIVTMNIFPTIYHGLKHSRLPKVRPDDFTAGKAIGFLFIPFYNFYWGFVFWTRLAQRINFQFKLRNQPPPVAEGLCIAVVILACLSIIPGVGLATAVVNWLILMPILSGQIQSATNRLVGWQAAPDILPAVMPAVLASPLQPPPASPLAPPPPPPASPLAPPPAPPRAARPRSKLALGLGIGGAVVLLGLIVLATKMAPPDDNAVRGFVLKELSSQGVKADNVWSEGRQFEGPARIVYNVNIQGRRPKSTYYQPVSDFELPDSTKGDVGALRAELRQLLQGKDGQQLRTLAGLTAEDDADLKAHLLREQTQTQDAVWNSRGQVIAARSGPFWEMTYQSPAGADPGSDAAQLSSKFPGRRFIVNRPEEAAALVEYGHRLEALRERLRDAAVRFKAERRAGVIKMFQSGGFFAGQATSTLGGPAKDAKAEIYLEITESRLQEEPPRLTALVRNDGGWEDARLFSGELDYDQQLGRLLLRLESPYREQAGAGPLLSNDPQGFFFESQGETIRLELAIVDGALVWNEHGASLRLEPGTGVNSRESVQARLTKRRQALIEATRLGQIYTGTITNRRNGASKAWLLQFDAQEPHAATSHALQAALEPRDDAGPAFTLSGILETNRHRSPEAPVRLDFQAGLKEVPPEFEREDDNSNFENLADLQLQLDGNRLVGETPRLLFRFEPAPPALADERRKAAEARLRAAEDAVLQHVRTGVTYEGTLFSFRGVASTPVLLQFTKVEDRGARVELQLRIKDQGLSDPFDTLVGKINAAEHSVQLNRSKQPDRKRPDNLWTLRNAAPAIWLAQPLRELNLSVESDRFILKPTDPRSDDLRLEFPLKP